MLSSSDAQHHCPLAHSGLRVVEAVSIPLRPSSKSLPSLLDHDTAAELLLLTSTDQLLDIRFRLEVGA